MENCKNIYCFDHCSFIVLICDFSPVQFIITSDNGDIFLIRNLKNGTLGLTMN